MLRVIRALGFLAPPSVAVCMYQPAVSHELALEELRRCAGLQFDPQVVESFCQLYRARVPWTAQGSTPSPSARRPPP